jgi:hypothetical protein
MALGPQPRTLFGLEPVLLGGPGSRIARCLGLRSVIYLRKGSDSLRGLIGGRSLLPLGPLPGTLLGLKPFRRGGPGLLSVIEIGLRRRSESLRGLI